MLDAHMGSLFGREERADILETVRQLTRRLRGKLAKDDEVMKAHLSGLLPRTKCVEDCGVTFCLWDPRHGCGDRLGELTMPKLVLV